MEKRGRGRPKGSKNRTTKQEEGSENVPTTNLRLAKPKAAKPPKQPKIVPEIRYEYTELAKISLGNTELINIYAVVICATAPH